MSHYSIRYNRLCFLLVRSMYCTVIFIYSGNFLLAYISHTSATGTCMPVLLFKVWRLVVGYSEHHYNKKYYTEHDWISNGSSTSLCAIVHMCACACVLWWVKWISAVCLEGAVLAFVSISVDSFLCAYYNIRYSKIMIKAPNINCTLVLSWQSSYDYRLVD